MTYLEFQTELMGFDYFDKKTGSQIYRWQLFLKRLTPEQVFKKYNTKIRNRDAN